MYNIIDVLLCDAHFSPGSQTVLGQNELFSVIFELPDKSWYPVGHFGAFLSVIGYGARANDTTPKQG